jgi:hypothetical protein
MDKFDASAACTSVRIWEVTNGFVVFWPAKYFLSCLSTVEKLSAVANVESRV